jgi:hypothetical protein
VRDINLRSVRLERCSSLVGDHLKVDLKLHEIRFLDHSRLVHRLGNNLIRNEEAFTTARRRAVDGGERLLALLGLLAGLGLRLVGAKLAPDGDAELSLGAVLAPSTFGALFDRGKSAHRPRRMSSPRRARNDRR